MKRSKITAANWVATSVSVSGEAPGETASMARCKRRGCTITHSAPTGMSSSDAR